MVIYGDLMGFYGGNNGFLWILMVIYGDFNGDFNGNLWWFNGM